MGKAWAAPKRHHGLAWRSARGLLRTGQSSTGFLGKLGEPPVFLGSNNRKGPHR